MKVLHLYTALDDGGVERFIFNYYENMDRSRICFDVIVPGDHRGILEEVFEKMGSTIYHVPTLHEDMVRHMRMVYHIIKEGRYDVVHCHGYKSFVGLALAWFCRSKVRIIHSHMAHEDESFLGKTERKVVACLCKIMATHRFACGQEAGIWLFGRKDYEKGSFQVIPNAINLDRFGFRPADRERLRKKLGLEGKFVIANVARFSYQKNQEFLVRVFPEILKKKSNAMLVFVGDGDGLKEAAVLGDELDVGDRILFLGARKDVNELLSAFDVFVLPSRYEGLPVSLVEVQASGLTGCVSDSVTQEVNITGLLEYISLEKSYEYWADRIIEQGEKCDAVHRAEFTMKGGQYDIVHQAKCLQEQYEKMASKHAKRFT